MRTRMPILVLCALLGASFALAAGGCASPYSGKPERLKKPRAKKKSDDEAKPGATAAAELDEKCRTNFFDEPTKKRREKDARGLSAQADRMLFDAEGKQGAERQSGVVDALSKLSNALKADPYGPEPTYQMAVAYALVGKKGCSLRLLERLVELRKHPDVSKEADRVIKRALHDQRFEPFRKDADTALGN
jgi:hypothetical protein